MVLTWRRADQSLRSFSRRSTYAETDQERIVDSLEPKQRRHYVWDTHLTGFGFLVLPSGIKSDCFQYRTSERRSRRATIGKHGAWTAEEARDKAEDLRHIVKAGGDKITRNRNGVRSR